MRNDNNVKIKNIIKLLEDLPYFTLNDVLSIETNKTYLKILFSRYKKSGKIIRLKRGFYTTSKYINNLKIMGRYSSYLEFLSYILYQPSYLSLEYILYEHNILTEMPVNFTSVAINKTTTLSNNLGTFVYRKIKKDLFYGFNINKDCDLIIYKATKAKALFDFLYLRKRMLPDEKAIMELRLNLNDFDRKDIKEFKRYVKNENTLKMKFISDIIFREV